MQENNSNFRKFVFGLVGVVAVLRIIFMLLEIFHQTKGWPLMSSYFNDSTDPFLYSVFCTSFFGRKKMFRKTSVRERFLFFGTIFLVLGVASELLQKYHISPGVYDSNDIVSFGLSYIVILMCILIDFFDEKIKRAVN